MSVDLNPYGASPHAPRPGAERVADGTRSVTLRRVDPFSVGKLCGALYALLGLVGAAVVALVTLVGATAGGGAEAVIGGVIGSILMILVMPIAYGFMGLILGLISGWLYNLGAGWVGGLVLHLET